MNYRPLRRSISAVLATLAAGATYMIAPAAAQKTPEQADVYTPLVKRIKAIASPIRVQVKRIGTSAGGRAIHLLAITSDAQSPSLSSRNRVMVICGQHGDERASVYAMADLAVRMARTSDPGDLSILRHTVILLVPDANPDGLARNRRTNANNVDLNRDWARLSQPETRAIARAARAYRPHLVIDEHEWTSVSREMTDSVEIPVEQSQLAQRLTTQLSTITLASMPPGGPPMDVSTYRPQSEPSLAHRRFIALGIPSMLLETSPSWTMSVRKRIYIDFTRAALASMADPTSPTLAQRIRRVRDRQDLDKTTALLASTFRRPDSGRNGDKPVATWAFVAPVLAFAALGLHRWSLRRSRVACRSDRCGVDTLPSDIREWDTTPMRKLSALRALRGRPAASQSEEKRIPARA